MVVAGQVAVASGNAKYMGVRDVDRIGIRVLVLLKDMHISKLSHLTPCGSNE
jgi:hypothetical protein